MRNDGNFSLMNAPSRYRWFMHLLFWIVAILYLTAGFKSRFENLGQSLKHTLFYLPGYMFIVYSFLYFLIPNFILKRRFIWFIVWLVPVFAVAAFYIRFVDKFIYTSREAFNDPRIFLHAIFATFNICGIAIAIKLFKYWYQENQAKQEAEKATLSSELELLKSQVHPHFLFNTLNNLYSLTLENSSQAPSIVLKLSGLLRYMLYECSADRVSLKKEIGIINDYIELEKIRYGDRLEVSTNYSGDIKNKMIAPLLMLPFLENSFKHGTSEQIEQCWISLDINVTCETMIMKLINSRYPSKDNRRGIGLENVKKRLDLLYQDSYVLKIIPDEEIFTVSLSLQLNS